MESSKQDLRSTLKMNRYNSGDGGTQSAFHEHRAEVIQHTNQNHWHGDIN